MEAAEGLTRLIMRIDRTMASAQARRDLQRLAARGDPANNLGIFYPAVLTVIGTLTYLALLSGAIIWRFMPPS